MTLERLQELSRRLAALCEDPQPGLATWQLAVEDVLAGLRGEAESGAYQRGGRDALLALAKELKARAAEQKSQADWWGQQSHPSASRFAENYRYMAQSTEEAANLAARRAHALPDDPQEGS